jgi:hypothetical protein
MLCFKVHDRIHVMDGLYKQLNLNIPLGGGYLRTAFSKDTYTLLPKRTDIQESTCSVYAAPKSKCSRPPPSPLALLHLPDVDQHTHQSHSTLMCLSILHPIEAFKSRSRALRAVSSPGSLIKLLGQERGPTGA